VTSRDLVAFGLFQFVTFASVPAAQTFFKLTAMHGLMIANKRVKLGWGKMTTKTNPSLLAAVDAGASRNVYVGGIKDFDLFNEDKLRRDFSEFGGGSLRSAMYDHRDDEY
jgi:hypothetical protein